ncbi:unnamed protein product, partial [Phaeothamnion confervicola]
WRFGFLQRWLRKGPRMLEVPRPTPRKRGARSADAAMALKLDVQKHDTPRKRGANAAALDGSASAEASRPCNVIKVAVRIRPLSAEEVAAGRCACCCVVNEGVVAISKAAVSGTYLRSQQGAVNEYAFDEAFDSDATQAQVYERTAKSAISDFLQGINVTVFCYGATAAGKTHTMMGSERGVGARPAEEGGEVSGIVPQALVDVFAGIEVRRADVAGRGRRDAQQWTVRVSYCEIYNEQILDLLEPTGRALRLNEDAARGVVVVAGIAEKEVRSSGEVLELLRRGNANRKTEATMANAVSSRSHAVLQVTLTHATLDPCGNDMSVESKLSLIDLAGSERASATNNTGALLRQGANINKSLLSLANCINALAANGRRQDGTRLNVKYRDSKLTHLLKASLEGRCRLIMVANINPAHHTYDDSHNTLKYANRAKQIKIDPKATVDIKEVSWPQREARLTQDNRALREEARRLERTLAAVLAAAGPHAPMLTAVANGVGDGGGGGSEPGGKGAGAAAATAVVAVAGGGGGVGAAFANPTEVLTCPLKRRRLDADAGAGSGSPYTEERPPVRAVHVAGAAAGHHQHNHHQHDKVMQAVIATSVATPDTAAAEQQELAAEKRRLEERCRELYDGRVVMMQLIDELRARKDEAEAAAAAERAAADECLRALAREEEISAALAAELAVVKRQRDELQQAQDDGATLLGSRSGDGLPAPAAVAAAAPAVRSEAPYADAHRVRAGPASISEPHAHGQEIPAAQDSSGGGSGG